MANVSWKRRELVKRTSQYNKVRDCIEGAEAVKSRTVKYLPKPNPADGSPANKLRYDAYLDRAVFYNVTGRTQRGFVGQIFARLPEVKVPALLAPLVADMTGLGVNAVQHMKNTAGELLGIGRCGLLSEFPNLANAATMAQLQNGEVKPILLFYPSEKIINWQYISYGGRRFYTLIVLEESIPERDLNGFSITYKKQYKVLRIDASGYYVQEVYKADNTDSVERSTPRFADGTRFNYIPFEFIGAEDNDAEPDIPPLYDLAELNLAHYRNSADYEELTYLVGQPTPVYSGLTQEWVDTNFAGGKVYLGSAAAVPLPSGGTASLLQAEPNQLAEQAMERKERQMVALGAKLAEANQVVKTATEASHDNAAESSQLETIADNIAVAYAQALASCAAFVMSGTPEISIKLNTAFQVVQMDAASRAQLIKEWQQGAISFEEMRSKLRGAGIATLPDAAAKAAILEEERQRAALNPDPANLDNPGADGE